MRRTSVGARLGFVVKRAVDLGGDVVEPVRFREGRPAAV
jgi:hypothetical protein